MSDLTVLELPVRRQTYAAVTPYITKDGSVIRELMHPAVHGNQLQSLAEATVQPGQRTQLHRHLRVRFYFYYGLLLSYKLVHLCHLNQISFLHQSNF